MNANTTERALFSTHRRGEKSPTNIGGDLSRIYPPEPSPRKGRQGGGRHKRTMHPRAIGSIKLDLEDLEKRERQNMKNFIRSAKRQGTVNAINQYLNISGTRSNTRTSMGTVMMLDHNQGSLLRSREDKNYIDNESDDEPLPEWILKEDKYEEIDVGINKQARLINPDGKFKLFWDNIQMILILYIILVFPFKLSYIEYDFSEIWNYADFMIDFIFLIDLILNFFTPFFKNNEFIQSHRRIASHYFQFWFWVDLISNIPIRGIFGEDPSQSNVYLISLVFSIPRLYKFVLSLKLLRITRLFRTSNKNFLTRLFVWIGQSDHLLISVLPIYIIGFAVAFVFSCFWHFNSNNTFERNTWLVRFQYNAESTHDQFWVSLYYVYSTVTTTGYGDLTPNSVSEFVLTIMFMIFGVVFYSLVYTTIIQKFDERLKKNQEFHIKEDMLKDLQLTQKNLKTVKGKKIV
jgi:hypothetical protein